MEQEIKQYFIKEKKVSEVVAKVLISSLLKYTDIAQEFCFWLKMREYKQNDKLVIEGYSAEDIHKLAPHLDTAGVYGFMVTLRDNPQEALEIIKNNFPRK